MYARSPASTVSEAIPVSTAAMWSGRVLSGLLMVRLFVIYHDQQHRAILPKSRTAVR